MKQAILLIVLTIIALELGFVFMGYEVVADIAYGAIALMALLIAFTFLWLWFERTTPLAIGMAVSWFGLASLACWWWVVNLLGTPVWSERHPLIFAILAWPLVGAVMHFAVIQRSFGYHGMHFLWPVMGALMVSFAVYVLV